MWKTTIWIIALNFLLNLNISRADSSDEHIHIKIHVPELFRKHTHVKKIQKHIFHPKKIIQIPESYFDNELDSSYSSPYAHAQYPSKHSYNHGNNYNAIMELYPDIDMLEPPHYHRPKKSQHLMGDYHHLSSELYPKLVKNKKKYKGKKKANYHPPPQTYEENYDDEDNYNDEFEAKMAEDNSQNHQYTNDNFNYHDSMQSLPVDMYQNNQWMANAEFLEPMKLPNEYNWETSMGEQYSNDWQHEDDYQQPSQYSESAKTKLFNFTHGRLAVPQRDVYEQYENNWETRPKTKKKRNKKKRYTRPAAHF